MRPWEESGANGLHGRSWHHPDRRRTHLRCRQQRWPAAGALRRRRVQPVFSQFTREHAKLSSAWRGKGKGNRGTEAQQVSLQPGGSPAIPTRPPAVHGNVWSLVRWEMVGSDDDFLRIFGGSVLGLAEGLPFNPPALPLPGSPNFLSPDGQPESVKEVNSHLFHFPTTAVSSCGR